MRVSDMCLYLLRFHFMPPNKLYLFLFCLVCGSYVFLTAFTFKYFVVFRVDEITGFLFAFLVACLLYF